MRTIHVLHGCPSDVEKAMNSETRTYDKHWIPWLKGEFQKEGIEVNTPLMPNPWYPDYQAFKVEFEKNPIGENDILIGHSCGAAFLVRWLGDTKQKVAKLVLVAPWKIPGIGDQLREGYYGYEIDKGISERVGEIVMFTSNDEEEDGKESLRVFHEALGGEVIDLPNHGHYTQGDMGTSEFPELLDVVRS